MSRSKTKVPQPPPKLANPVAKHCRTFNKAHVFRDKKNDYTRAPKHKLRGDALALLALRVGCPTSTRSLTGLGRFLQRADTR